MLANYLTTNYAPSLKVRAAAELERRRRRGQAAVPNLGFREFIQRVNSGFRFYRHVDLLLPILERVVRGEIARLLIFEPPRHGKSELVSRLLPAYYLYCHPERWVGLNSYGADLAYGFSRNARDHYLRAGGELRGDARAVKQWVTQAGGGLWAAGVGGPITGKGFHLGLIDDPVKNAEEAASVTIQARHRDWYSSTFYTRGEPNNAIIITLTRWHENDMAGWLLRQELDEGPEHWHIVNLPAIAEREAQAFPPTCTVEQDWRAVGEALCPERYPQSKLQRIEQRIGPYFWNALFQQHPVPPEGSKFKRDWFEIVPAAPAHAQRVRGWDKAGTEDAGDYTAGVLMAKDANGIFYVEDVARGQYGDLARERMIKQCAALDQSTHGHVAIWLEQEPGSSGKDSARSTIRNLAGHSVYAEPSTGDKVVRASPFAAQCAARNVKLVAGPWNQAYLDELANFPYGAHDDQVDASSLAFNKLNLTADAEQGANPFYTGGDDDGHTRPTVGRKSRDKQRLDAFGPGA